MPWTSLLTDHLLTTTLLFAVVWIATHLVKRPVIRHLLWVTVLLKFLLPPLVSLEIPRPSAPPETISAAATAASRPDPGQYAFRPIPRAMIIPAEPPPPDAEATSPIPASVPSTDFRANDRTAIPWPTSDQLRGALLLAWGMGSLIVLLIALARTWRFQRLLSSTATGDPTFQGAIDDLSRQAGLKQPPTARLTSAAVSPMLWAMFRPTLIFPNQLWQTLPHSERQTLLLHELAHLARGDHWVRRLELLVTMLWWWHPAVWLSRRELHAAEEECCDQWVVARNANGRRQYADALLATLDYLADPSPCLPPVACGMGRITRLERRLTMILHHPNSRLGFGSGALLSLGVLGLLGTSLTFAQAPPNKDKDKDNEKGTVTIKNPKGITIESADSITIESQGDTTKDAAKDQPAGGARSIATFSTGASPTGKPPTTIQPADAIANIAGPSGKDTFLAKVTPDGNSFVTTGSDGNVQLFAANGESIRVFDPGVKNALTQVAITSNGKRLAAGGFDGVITLWELKTGEKLATTRQSGGIRSLSFSENGKWLVSGSWDNVARLWNGKTLEKVGQTPTQSLPEIADISPDGSLIATVTGEWKQWRQPGELKLWNRKTMDLVRTLPGHRNEIKGVSFSDDGQRLLTFGSDATARVWDVSSGQPLAIYRHPTAVTAAAFIPKSNLIATGDLQGTVRFWNLASTVVGPKPATPDHADGGFRAHQNLLYRINPTPDGTLILTNSRDGRLKLWPTGHGTPDADWTLEKLGSGN